MPKIKFSYIIIVALIICIIANAINHTKELKSAYNDGYNAAVESAEFYKFSNDGYFIQFGEEVHEYKF